jgi:uncharacterized protein
VLVLVDTSALLALAYARDQWHSRATRAARANASSGVRYVGTTLVLGEFHAHLLYLRGPADAREAITRLTSDPTHEWLGVDADLVQHATARWLARFPDQRFSLADAVSFEIMKRERITHAFAFDKHFEAAGFALVE